MGYFRMVFSRESEWRVLEKLGRLGLLEVENLNAGVLQSSLPFDHQIKETTNRLDKVMEIESILITRGFLEEREEFSVENTDQILNELTSSMRLESHWKFFGDIFEQIDARYHRLKEQLDQLTTIEAKIVNMRATIEVLRILKTQLPESFVKYARPNYSGNLALDYFAGTIDNGSVYQLQKALFRITRGNAYITYNAISPEKSCVFIAVQSTGSGQIKEKINRICQSLNFTLISIPNDANELQMTLELSREDLNELYQIKTNSQDVLTKVLTSFVEESGDRPYSRIYYLKTLLLKHNSQLEQMNRLSLGKTFTSSNFWIPESKVPRLNQAVKELKQQAEFGSLMLERLDFQELGKKPPTSFRTKGFFDAFQSIVDTYGVARYKEGNPGLFTAVTFPFLFGCMFGDVGHGSGVLIFALLLLAKPQWFSRTFLSVKWLFLLMGIYATWCGLIYNEFFAVPLVIADTCYVKGSYDLMTRMPTDCVYPVGIDYSWAESPNSVAFLNSFKMKISIVYGVIQMTGGILIKGSNALYFKNLPEFFTEFIPQLLFMLCTFGYMVVCIIIKWCTDYSQDPSKAPSIIALFINLVGGIESPLYATATTQLLIQKVLAGIAVACVPIMLFGKPIIGHIIAGKHPRLRYPSGDVDEHASLMSHEVGHHNKPAAKEEGHEDLSEAFIHQGIETIEFVLGSVSNTASYLRIWALSLAHSQLAKVFLDLLLGGSIKGENSLLRDIPMAVFMFAALMVVTIGVLMFMDLLECFLHTLRLHWVEFQSKFYKGDGIPFRPFSFAGYIDTNLNQSVK
jgi:V-type H+-transporting ATPase subunit a